MGVKLKKHVQKLCDEIKELSDEIKKQEERYHCYRASSNGFHNAGSQRCVDGDGKGALKRFALRDRDQKEWQDASAKIDKLTKKRDKLQKELDAIPAGKLGDIY